jgi:hypothetical protein
VRILGEPPEGIRIAGGENDFEEMTYPLEPDGQVFAQAREGKGSANFPLVRLRRFARPLTITT